MTGDGTIVDRSVLGRIWRLRRCDDALALSLSQRLGLDEITGRVLAGRGVGLDQAPGFLEPRLRAFLPDPSHLLDLDRAAAHLADTVQAGERIGLLGDYDVDGASSTALLARFLRAVGVAAETDIPDRLTEGYGPGDASLGRLAARGCRTIVTLDTGMTAHAPLQAATAAGHAIIVVDHHLGDADLPPALAVVNPNRADQATPLKHLAAVGVTFMLVIALGRELRRRGFFAGRPEPDALQWLDLVALGTVCDVVPLTGLNRAFVHQGMKVLARGSNPGLAALAQQARLAAIGDAWQLGYALGPRINAGGRIGRSDLGARLLATDDPSEAAGLAQRLDELNQRRQAMEREQMAIAVEAVAPSVARDRSVVVAADARFHPGVVGILASRLVERVHRPAFVVALGEDGLGRGSARSVPGFDLGSAVLAARDAGIVLKGGGHAMAAGITIEIGRIDELEAFVGRRFGKVATGPAGPAPFDLDGSLAVGGVTPGLALQLERLAPFGAGNAEPLFALQDARVVDVRPVGDGHLGCTLSGPAGGRVKAVAFRCRGNPLGDLLLSRQPLRLAGRVKVDRWQGREGAQFQIEDAAPIG